MNIRRLLLIAVPGLWLVALFLVPFAVVAKIALSDTAIAIPPYRPVLDLSAGLNGFLDMLAGLDAENFVFLGEDALYFKAFVSSVAIALLATALTLVVGFPLACAMAEAPPAWRPVLVMLAILPFWTSFLIRVYAWMGILSRGGLLNRFLGWAGVTDSPLALLNTDIAVQIGIVYTYLPFMVLPVYATLHRLDRSLLEAAEDLGCSRFEAFWLVTAPLAMPGVVAGCFLVFIPVLGEFVIPSLLGGSDTLMIGKVLWEEFSVNRDWPVASAVAVTLLILLVVPIVLFQRHQDRIREADG